jgi:hypothetical protein
MRVICRTLAMISIAALAIIANTGPAFATAQIEDSIIFKGNEYSLIGKTEGEFATPEQFGMTAVTIHTACYRGYYATYEVTEENLILRKFTLREKDGNYLPISGVLPVIDAKKIQSATYSDLNVVVPFSGRIRLAREFIRDFYIHMGYQKATAFKTVLDLTLNDGRVVEIKDRSEEMEKKRGAFKKAFSSGEINKSIEDAFSLDMKLE